MPEQSRRSVACSGCGTSPVSRFAVGLRLAVAALATGISAELPWAIANEEISIAGAVAVPSMQVFALLALIMLVGAWVLPWWVELTLAVGAFVTASVIAFAAVRWLLDPDIADGTLTGIVGLRLPGPLLFFLAIAIGLWALLDLVRGVRTWPGMSTRYTRTEDSRSGRDAWRALDRGDDPTDWID